MTPAILQSIQQWLPQYVCSKCKLGSISPVISPVENSMGVSGWRWNFGSWYRNASAPLPVVEYCFAASTVLACELHVMIRRIHILYYATLESVPYASQTTPSSARHVQCASTDTYTPEGDTLRPEWVYEHSSHPLDGVHEHSSHPPEGVHEHSSHPLE